MGPIEYLPEKLPQVPVLDIRSILKKIKVGRNSPCPCGSGKKFKRCCLDKIRR